MLLGSACQSAGSTAAPTTATPGATLTPYRSEAELGAALERWRTEAAKLQAERRRDGPPLALSLQSQSQMAAPAAPAAAAKSADAATAGAAAESITNVQTAGVDEGGIVKRAGDHLVILRRGRLFTVKVGGDALQPVAMVDAFAPGSDPRGAWYDELLIAGSTVVVVGYSYNRGGTEISLFELDGAGALAYRATYHLRSFDYYSSRNYASRLIGRKLVFYSPTLLQPGGPSPLQLMPGFRRWQHERPQAAQTPPPPPKGVESSGKATLTQDLPPDFERILPATRIYRTDDDFDPAQPLALHTVTSCDLAQQPLRCESSAVLGPAGRVFYVSQGSVYVWTAPPRRRFPMPPAQRPVEPAPERPLSAVFRIPLDGTAPTGLKTAGVPIDQMSFLEDGQGRLNVLLRASGSGEGMWGSETTPGALALLRVPLAAFGDGRGAAQREHYRVLPAAAGGALQNRFVGDWLLWGGSGGASAWALRYADAGAPTALTPGHGVERIEAMGDNAVLVGQAGADLHFTSIRLGRGTATPVARHVQPGARQGETRTHGFFYRPTGIEEGLLGLPLLQSGSGQRGVFAGAQGSASVLYLRQRELGWQPLGALSARPGDARDDGCRASCVDWYGNARPIFLGDRVFALMGYELVEGQLAGRGANERIDERRRASFAPGAREAQGRYSPFN
ncbi:beta-propeller domain-containing protein [Aquincola sp. S2]|uniref:Beta-propeller domain-containing protein n=2 Tax=Pseudaquabacterium terrae TaxID=2732868 RepID=A0ABX2EGX1_9BURK|nr:beta-propeller domain-containing protein [Aquabacterium terrae]